MIAEPSFFARIVLAYVAFFRVLFHGGFAASVQKLTQGQSPQGDAAAYLPVPSLVSFAELSPAPAPVLAPERDMQSAVALLALLQLEARLVDFAEQEIDSFSDADVGSAARLVHAGCRKVLRGRANVQPIHAEAEGARVRIEVGFDAAAIKLLGNVGSKPPYSGVLRHRGWKISDLSLPQIDAAGGVLAQAEVEL